MATQTYGFGSTLGAGFDAMFDEGRGYKLEVVKLTDILVKKQIREEMEDESSTLDDMAGSIKKHGILQTLLLRPITGPIPYELVAGERRYLGACRTGEEEAPALIKEMTDEEASDIQLAENIHRKNLTQIEEAIKIQNDLNELGSVDAVLAKHSKGRAWLSKILSLLSLPEQAKRLISEHISADVEVINMVKTVENIDKVAGKNLVDELKETKGKVDARKLAEKAKAVVKPPKPRPSNGAARGEGGLHGQASTATTLNFAGVIASTPGPTAMWPEPTRKHARTSPPPMLADAYDLIFTNGASPNAFIESLSKQAREDLHKWLECFYCAGRDGDNVALGVIRGLRNETFTAKGPGAFAMLAFLQGGDARVARFSLLDVLCLAKA